MPVPVIPVRLWTFEITSGPGGGLMADYARLQWKAPLQVDLALMALVNALGCDNRRTANFQVHLSELRLLLSHVDVRPHDDHLVIAPVVLSGVSGHIRRFVAEATGMGVLSGTSAQLMNWRPHPHNVANFDVLPTHLHGRYSRVGVRPDLLFDVPGGPAAGEARGRTRRAKKPLPRGPVTGQWKRLDQLAAWSKEHGSHPFFMSWTYLGPSGVAADVFIPATGDALAPFASLPPGPVLEVKRPPSSYPARPGATGGNRRGSSVDDSDVREQPGFDEQWSDDAIDDQAVPPPFRYRAADRPGKLRSVEYFDEDLPEAAPFLAWDGTPEAWHKLAGRAADIAARLYETAPTVLGRLGRATVRGAWGSADLFGEARHRVLLALLSEPGTAELGSAAPRREPVRTPGLAVALRGRVLAAVADAEGPEPTWEQVLQALGDHWS